MMTFNEFKQLAENPPRKDEPSVFKVAVYGIDTLEMDQESENGDKESPRHREYYPEFPLYCYHEVLAATLPDAEAMMGRLFQDVSKVYCAVAPNCHLVRTFARAMCQCVCMAAMEALLTPQNARAFSPKSVATIAISGAEHPKKSALRKIHCVMLGWKVYQVSS